MKPESPSRFKIAICGGGIGGLALASFLSKSDHITVDIFEVKPEIRTIGAGIAVWKRYWEVLGELPGFLEDCEQRGVTAPKDDDVRGPILRMADISTGGHDFYALSHGPMILSRITLMDVLQTKHDPSTCRVYTSKRLTHYTLSEQGPVILHFDDGTTSPTDILVGADGVHSSVRATMFETDSKYAEPKWSGQLAYRMQCLKEDLRKVNPNHVALSGFRIWCGKGRHVTSNTVGNIIHITAYDNVPGGENTPFTDPWVLDVSNQEVAKCFREWEPDLVSLLLTASKSSRWAIHVVSDLPHFVSGNIALIGDAAHAMTPHQGLGGGQGIEDAYILSHLLSHPVTTIHNVKDVLKIYEEIRLPLSQKVAARSLANGLMYGFLLPEYDGASLDVVGKDLSASCDWLIQDHGCNEEWAKAKAMLEELEK